MRLHATAAALVLCAAGCSTTTLTAQDGTFPRSLDVDATASVLRDHTSSLLGAGGGRPSTGYVGAAFVLPMPTSDELDGGWALDVNYTHNFTEGLSLELALGRWQYEVDHGGDTGSLTAVSLGALCQFGRGHGATKWYAGAGLAFMMNELSGVAATQADDSLAVLAAAGADIPLSATGSLCIELRYLLSTADLSDGTDLDLNAPALRLNYVFLY